MKGAEEACLERREHGVQKQSVQSDVLRRNETVKGV